MKRLLMLASTNLISWGEAFCMSQAIGRPEASVIAMILVSLSRLVLSTKRPLFCGCEAAIDKGFTNIDFTSLLKILSQFGENLFKCALLGPLLEPTIATLMWWIPCGRSFHGAPVLSIHRMPLRTPLGLRRGRPRPSCFLLGDGIKCLSRVHCSFVSSIPVICDIF